MDVHLRDLADQARPDAALMTLTRPRLLLVGAPTLDASLVEALEPSFEVVHVRDAAEAARLAREDAGALVLVPAAGAFRGADAGVPDTTARILQFIGEGVALVDSSGGIAWANARLRDYPEDVRRRFAELCRQAIDQLNQPAVRHAPVDRRGTRQFSFQGGDAHYELVASPASAEPLDPGRVASVVGVLWDVTATRRLLEKLDAIDAAGSELMKIEADTITRLNASQRLELLEEKIVRYAHDLLNFDHFEVRLLDPRTNRLELVISEGISPGRIGEVLYPQVEGSGITGYVAATGESYLCPSVKDDPLYREGLDDAASSLTVPLRLHDRVVGVFNIESKTPGAFEENDRQFATIFGRYIAMAMNILNLLVVERYTTNEQVARTVLGELSLPLREITERVQALRDANVADAPTRKGLEQIVESVGQLRKRIEACTAGPRTILGAEPELFRAEPDPGLRGKRVMVADDDENIRRTVCSLLRQRGCDVTVCESGV